MAGAKLTTAFILVALAGATMVPSSLAIVQPPPVEWTLPAGAVTAQRIQTTCHYMAPAHSVSVIHAGSTLPARATLFVDVYLNRSQGGVCLLGDFVAGFNITVDGETHTRRVFFANYDQEVRARLSITIAPSLSEGERVTYPTRVYLTDSTAQPRILAKGEGTLTFVSPLAYANGPVRPQDQDVASLGAFERS